MRLALLLATLLLAGSTPREPSAREKPVDALSLEEMGLELHRLRALPSHFVRSPGTWHDDRDSWGSRMHQVMGKLVTHFGTPGTPRAALIATMGEPDQIAKPGDTLWDYAPRDAPPGSEMLIYHWRGLHDFAWLLVHDGEVVRADWYFAYE